MLHTHTGYNPTVHTHRNQYTLHKKVKDIKYPELFCVVDICYTCTHSIYQLHKKLRMFNILNFYCVVYVVYDTTKNLWTTEVHDS